MYKDIQDLPVKVFHRIVETGNLSLLSDNKESDKDLTQAWDLINDQLIKEFGVSDEFRMIFYKQQDINTLEIKLLEGDTSVEFFLNDYKRQLESLKSGMVKVDDYKKYHAKLHRILTARFNRDTHNLSTFEFYNDLHDYTKEVEEKELQTAFNG